MEKFSYFLRKEPLLSKVMVISMKKMLLSACIVTSLFLASCSNKDIGRSGDHSAPKLVTSTNTSEILDESSQPRIDDESHYYDSNPVTYETHEEYLGAYVQTLKDNGYSIDEKTGFAYMDASEYISPFTNHT